MRVFGAVLCLLGLGMFFGGMYMTEAYGLTKGFVEFLLKMLTIVFLLAGGVAFMGIGGSLAKSKK